MSLTQPERRSLAGHVAVATANPRSTDLTGVTRTTSPFEPSRSPWTGRMLSVLRVVAGLIFLSAGTMKVFGWPPSSSPMPPFDPLTQMGIGGMLEVVGGLAITIGFLTRPVAFVLAGEMMVAYFQFHAPQSPFPTVNDGIPAILYCFLYLYLMLAGAGPWSVDARMAAARRHAPGRGRGARAAERVTRAHAREWI